jgi:hypothetical protein
MHQWRTFSDTEKIVAFQNVARRSARTHVEPLRGDRPSRRNLRLSVFECMMKAGLQFTRNRERANARDEILERLDTALRAHTQDPIAEGERSWLRRNGMTAASNLTAPLAFLKHCSAVSL